MVNHRAERSPTPVRNFLPDDVPIKYEPVDLRPQGNLGLISVADKAFHVMTNSTFASLSKVRLAIEAAVSNMRNNLCMSSHDDKVEIEKLKSRLMEEKECLKRVKRKLAKKVDSHDQAHDEYECARQVCINARQDEGSATDVDQAINRKSFVRQWESL